MIYLVGQHHWQPSCFQSLPVNQRSHRKLHPIDGNKFTCVGSLYLNFVQRVPPKQNTMGIISISIHFGWLPILAKTKFGWAWSPSILISDHNDWWLQYILYYIYISYIYIINQYVLWICGPLSTTTPGVGLTSKNNTCWNINLSLTRRLHFLPFAHRCSGSNGNSHARPLCPAHLLPGFCFFFLGVETMLTSQGKFGMPPWIMFQNGPLE